MRKFLLYIVVLMIFSSCSHKFHSPEIELPQKFNHSESSDSVKNIINMRWWEIFGDTTLNRLIDYALLNNQDANIAYANIEQARSQLRVEKAAYLPSFGFGISGEGEYNREEGIIQEYIVKPTVSWEISLFGAMKNTTLVARASLLTVEYNYAAIMLSLAAEVATTYFSLIEYRKSLDISQTTYNNRKITLALIDSLVSYGMSTSLDYEQSYGLTVAASASISQYERLVAQTQAALSVLLGETPRFVETMINFSDSYNELPEYVPAGLPSDLLLRRPDILEAYSNLMKASAEVGIAKAARFPSITLTAGGGLLSTTVKKLISSDPYALAWNGLFSITQPIFQFGKLKSGQKIAQNEFEIAELNYRKSIISAFEDVDNALIAITTLKEQSDRYKELIESNKKLQYITSQLYNLGMVDYLNYLDAERNLFSSQIEYISLITQKYSAYVSLYKALGGGWY